MKTFASVILALAFGAAHAAAPAPCTGPEYRQFDFWIGDWQVHKPDGSLAGINRVTLEYNRCVVHERYATGKGYSGESLNSYDSSRKVWHQTWVDDSGLLLTLEGKLVGASMILEGMAPAQDGTPVKQRITWTPNKDGSVRQLWESADAKGGWTVAFDGLYTKR